MRIYAENTFEENFPGKGIDMEGILFDLIRLDLASSGHQGMDFYPFRKQYKNRLQTILENLKNDTSNLKNQLQSVCDVDNMRTVLSMDPKEWNKKLWGLDIEELEQEEDSEMREGTFDCLQCARRGLYSKNTSHYDQQTRSSDEPATIFMHCHTCGKNYRFSS